jgi:Spy/CpxP family protein refolding chaperone
MRAIFLAAGAVVFASTVAFADDTKPVAPTPAAATDDSNKLVCHPVTHEGQLVGQTCHTQKEWDRMRFQEQQQLRQYQERSLYQPK